MSHKSLGKVAFLDLGAKNSQIEQPVYVSACIGGSEPLNKAPLNGGGGTGAAPPHGAESGQAPRQDAALGGAGRSGCTEPHRPG